MEEKRRPDLPDCAIAFIDLVARKFRYRKKVRQEVRDELVAHFEDELREHISSKKCPFASHGS